MSHIKQHRIRFQDRPVDKTEEMLEEELIKVKGMKNVEVDFGNSDISVEYDLIEISEADIEKRIEDMGFNLDKSLLERFKRSWIHFTEENERDNLMSSPSSCCSNPVEVYRSRDQKKGN